MIPAALTQALEASHQSLDLLIRGDPEPRLELFSRAEDVTLANPLGALVRGFDQVAAATRRTVAQMRDGEPIRFEPVSQVVTPDLAYVVEIERSRVKLGGVDQLVPFSLRSTTVYRREEDGVWRICHRHADPVTTPRPIETLIDRS